MMAARLRGQKRLSGVTAKGGIEWAKHFLLRLKVSSSV